MPVENILLFQCPKCRWWIAGTHSSEEPIEGAKLNEIMFKLKCVAPLCGWKGKLAGREGVSASRPPSQK
jgi:hypothetical protein